MTITDQHLHKLARECAAELREPDKKQLRFNEIVQAARDFYSGDVQAGIRELVASCDKADRTLYVKGRPMWQVLANEYAWMKAA